MEHTNDFQIDVLLVPAELTNLKAKDMAVGQVCGCTSGDVGWLTSSYGEIRNALLLSQHAMA